MGRVFLPGENGTNNTLANDSLTFVGELHWAVRVPVRVRHEDHVRVAYVIRTSSEKGANYCKKSGEGYARGSENPIIRIVYKGYRERQEEASIGNGGEVLKSPSLLSVLGERETHTQWRSRAEGLTYLRGGIVCSHLRPTVALYIGNARIEKRASFQAVV